MTGSLTILSLLALVSVACSNMEFNASPSTVQSRAEVGPDPATPHHSGQSDAVGQPTEEDPLNEDTSTTMPDPVSGAFLVCQLSERTRSEGAETAIGCSIEKEDGSKVPVDEFEVVWSVKGKAAGDIAFSVEASADSAHQFDLWIASAETAEVSVGAQILNSDATPIANLPAIEVPGTTDGETPIEPPPSVGGPFLTLAIPETEPKIQIGLGDGSTVQCDSLAMVYPVTDPQLAMGNIFQLFNLSAVGGPVTIELVQSGITHTVTDPLRASYFRIDPAVMIETVRLTMPDGSQRTYSLSPAAAGPGYCYFSFMYSDIRGLRQIGAYL